LVVEAAKNVGEPRILEKESINVPENVQLTQIKALNSNFSTFHKKSFRAQQNLPPKLNVKTIAQSPYFT